MLIRYYMGACLYVCSSTVALAVSELQATVIGRAYSLEDQRLVYNEYHYIDNQDYEHRVVYQTPQQELLVEKSISYRSGMVTPEVYQQSFTTGEKFKIEWADGKVNIRYNSDENAATQTAAIHPSGELVIDAGFNHFVQQKWQQLVDGEKLAFYFPAPKRQVLVELEIGRAACRDDQHPSVSAGNVCFSIQLAQWVFRWLMPPIELTYDGDSRQLLRYRGVGNVPSGDGRSYRVDVHYQYFTPKVTVAEVPIRS